MGNHSDFKPKLFSILLSDYSFAKLQSDFIAGLVVAIVSLPLAMALAIASGVSPDKGLITAVVAGFIISVFGGSRVQIGGPTGAFVVVIFNVIASFGYDGLLLATIVSGIILVIAGYMRLGRMIKWIPLTVVTGFTSGIAVIIATSQIKDFFGLCAKDLPADFIDKWIVYFNNCDSLNIYAMIMGGLSLLFIIIMKRVAPRIPSYFIVVLLCSFATYYFNLPVETIGAKFPEMTGSSNIFSFELPTFSYTKLIEILPSAFTIAFLAGVESLLSAVVADGMINSKHRPNQELVAQGFANIITPLFGGIPATGAIARTATNVRSGAKSPMSGVFNSIFILLFSLYFMDVIALIPLSALAAILLMVAWSMAEVDNFVNILKIPSSERLVLLLTFTLTIMVDLTFAIGIGVTIASILFMSEMSETIDLHFQKKHPPKDTANKKGKRRYNDAKRSQLPEGVEVFHINGPIFFGVADKLLSSLTSIGQTPKVIILRMRHTPYVDISGERALEQIIQKSIAQGIKIIFNAIQEQPKSILLKAGIRQDKENIFFTKNYKEAVDLSKNIVAASEVADGS